MRIKNRTQRNIPMTNLHKVAPIWTASNQPVQSVRPGDFLHLHKSVDILLDLCSINYLYLGCPVSTLVVLNTEQTIKSDQQTRCRRRLNWTITYQSIGFRERDSFHFFDQIQCPTFHVHNQSSPSLRVPHWSLFNRMQISFQMTHSHRTTRETTQTNGQGADTYQVQRTQTILKLRPGQV